MPLTRSGTDVREFLLPSIFEASTISQVREIPRPVDKAHSIVGSTGIGLVYKFDSSSSAADDGYEILRPDDTTWSGRWLLIPLGAASGGDGIYNVKSFGATGDGVTDDQAAIQSAIDEATTKQGGIVFFPSGDYLIKATLVLTPGVRLMGVSGQDNTTASGIGSTISSQTVATPSVSFTGDGTTNNSSSVEVASLRIIDTGGSPTTAVTLTSARNCYINGCYFQGFSEASVNLFSGEGNIVDRVMVGSSDGIGIKFSGVSKQSQLSNSKIEGCASASGAVQIIGTVDGVRVQGNQITNNYGKGIYVSTPASTSEHIAIENNLFDGNDATDTGDQDVYFLAATSHTNVSVVGNQFVSVGTSTALKLESVSDSTIDNNSFAAANASVTLDATSDNNLLLGNKISGTTSDLGSGNRWDLGYDDDQINDRQLSKGASNGLYFEGTDNVETATSAAVDFGTGDFSASGIAYFATTPGDDATLCDKRRGGGTTAGFMVFINSSGRLVFELGDGSTGINGTNDGDDLTGKLFHWAVSFDRSGNATRYVNGAAYGVVDAITTAAGSVNNSHGIRLAERSSDKRFTGKIYSTVVFNRALTAAEVLRLSINGNVPEVSDQYGNATELLVDGNMEDAGVTHWDDATQYVTVSKETTTPHSGTNCLRLTHTGTGSCRTQSFDAATAGLLANRWVHLTGWARSDGTTRVPVVRFDGGTWQTIWTGTTSTSWQEIDVYVQLNSDSNMRLTLASLTAGSIGEYVEFDDFTLTQVGAVLSLQPDNIEINGAWTDATSNGLNGATTGATQILPKTLDRDYVNDRQLSKSPSNGLRFKETADVMNGTGLGSKIGLLDWAVSWVMAWPVANATTDFVHQINTTNADGIWIDLNNKVNCRINATDYIINQVITVHDEFKHYLVTADRSGNATLYINGVAQSGAIDISAQVAYAIVDGSGWRVGEIWAASTIDMTLLSLSTYNRLPSAAEILRLAANGNVPDVSDQWGGVPGAKKTETTWAGATGTTRPNGFVANGTCNYTVATKTTQTTALNMVGNSGNGMYLNPFCVVGRRYRLEIKIFETAGGIQIKTGSDIHVQSDGGAAWKTHIVDFQATAGALTFYLDAASSDVWIDDLVITDIGAVLALQPDNIESDGDWIDASTNRLSGTNTGASPLKKDIRLDLDDTDAATGETVLNVGTGLIVQKGGDLEANHVAVGGSNAELTIATGAVVISQGYHSIDTEGDAGTDDLDTMTFSGKTGTILFIRPNHPSRDVVVTNAGNIVTNTGASITLTANEDHLSFVWNGSQWIHMGTNIITA